MPLLDHAAFCNACGTAVRVQAKPHKTAVAGDGRCRRRPAGVDVPGFDRARAGSTPGTTPREPPPTAVRRPPGRRDRRRADGHRRSRAEGPLLRRRGGSGMSQNPPWPPQGQDPQGGYPPSRVGYPQGGYPPPGSGRLPAASRRLPRPGYPPQRRRLPPAGAYPPQGGYPPQGARRRLQAAAATGGYASRAEVPPPPAAAFRPGGAAGRKKSTGSDHRHRRGGRRAAGGGRRHHHGATGGGDEPPPVPSPPPTPTPPTDAADDRTDGRADRPSPSGRPPSGHADRHRPRRPAATAVDLGNGINLTPAAGWEVAEDRQGRGPAQQRRDIFLGQVIQAGRHQPGPAVRRLAPRRSPRAPRTASSRNRRRPISAPRS